jgi:hypothetical protein
MSLSSFSLCFKPRRSRPFWCEAIAFVVGKSIGLTTSTASADYISLYHGNAALLMESLELVQQTSAVILAAIQTEEVRRSK